MPPRGRQRAEKWRDPEGPPPTLGPIVCDWWEHYIPHGPGDVQGRPWQLTADQQLALYRIYELDAEGRRSWSEVANVGPKGTAKSEFGGGLCVLEGLGPVRFDGWDANGDPVGRPLESVEILIFANDETQTDNTYANVAWALAGEPEHGNDALLADYGPFDIGRSWQSSTRTNLAHARGSIETHSAGASSKDGGKSTFLVWEETHRWLLPELHNLHRITRRNLVKRAMTAQPWGYHATNFYDPSEGSVLQMVHADAEAKAGRLLWLMREVREGLVPPDKDLRDLPDKVLLQALRDVYGSASWLHLPSIVEQIRRPSEPDGESRRFFLNQGRSSDGKWVHHMAWSERMTQDRLQPGDRIAIGFDGSRYHDATALVACRLSDRLVQPLRIWEKPEGPAGKSWEVTSAEVDTEVAAAMARYQVKLAYGDPPYWQTDIESWALKWGEKVWVKFDTARDKAMAEALERWDTALVSGQLAHTGDQALSTHVLNAERGKTRSGYRLRKPAGVDRSTQRSYIDGGVAAVLAHEAACDAVAAGLDVSDEPALWAY